MVKMEEYELKSVNRNPLDRMGVSIDDGTWWRSGLSSRNQRIWNGASPSSITHDTWTRELTITLRNGIPNGVIRGGATGGEDICSIDRQNKIIKLKNNQACLYQFICI